MFKRARETAQFLRVDVQAQILQFYEHHQLIDTYVISSAKNGLGEKEGSECTPRGWHRIHAIIGQDTSENSVFVSRSWTGEIYTETLAAQHPDRDWILTRIIQIEGMEEGRNRGRQSDSLARYIYLHATPDTNPLGKPLSHGCIRMRHSDIITLSSKIQIGAPLFIF